MVAGRLSGLSLAIAPSAVGRLGSSVSLASMSDARCSLTSLAPIALAARRVVARERAMYGHNARQEVLAILKDAPELKDARVPNRNGEPKAIPLSRMRALTDRLLVELWLRGFAVSARALSDKPPKNGMAEAIETHNAVRSMRAGGQTDLEDMELAGNSPEAPPSQ